MINEGHLSAIAFVNPSLRKSIAPPSAPDKAPHISIRIAISPSDFGVQFFHHIAKHARIPSQMDVAPQCTQKLKLDWADPTF